MEFCRPQRLLFDLDGTLIGCLQWYTEALFFKNVLLSLRKKVGLLNAFRSIKRIKSALEERRPGQDTNYQLAVKIFSAINRLDPIPAEALYRTTLEENFYKLRPNFHPIREALTFLDWATRNYQLTLATNPLWPQKIIETRMRWGGLVPNDFDWITNSENMHNSKPHTSYYKELLHHYNASGKMVLHIGNDFDQDYPAVTAGIPVFIIKKNADASMGIVKKKLRHLDITQIPCWVGTFDELKNCLRSG